MGYTTDFKGSFDLDFSELTDQEELDTIALLDGLANTRRMKRDLSRFTDIILPKPISDYGVEGEFYYNKDGNRGQTTDPSVIEYNIPPSTQPSLWLQWIVNNEGTALEWDTGEKFYNYIEWLEYLIKKIFKPRGIIISGSVEYRGEDWNDHGTITIKDYIVTTI